VDVDDERAMNLRGSLAKLSLKVDGLREHKRKIIHELNDINDATTASRAKCDGIDELCTVLEDRLTSARTLTAREEKLCDDLSHRIERDRNKCIVADVAAMLDNQCGDSSIVEFVMRHLGSSSDPDGLLSDLNALYVFYHKKVKDASQAITQLRTGVNLARNDIEHAENRLVALQRAKQTQALVKKDAKPSRAIDRKVVPTKPRPATTLNDHDELGVPSKRSRRSGYNFFT
jgi:DNA repair ATPase RecN